jgi:hypothetical protein
MVTCKFTAMKNSPTTYLLLLLLCLFTLSGYAATYKNFLSTSTTIFYFTSDQPMPSPDLLPQQVVAIQLKALQDNDENNTGIAITFNFAAPGNKAYTGPLDRFIQLLKNPAYAPLLNFKKCEVNKIHIEGDEAQQLVIITDQNGRKAAYLFSLSRQQSGPYQNCWMTDSVIRLAYEEKLVKA